MARDRSAMIAAIVVLGTARGAAAQTASAPPQASPPTPQTAPASEGGRGPASTGQPGASVDQAPPQPVGGDAPNAVDPADPTKPLVDLDKALPPPTKVVYFQVGVAFTAEFVSAPGPICDNVTVPCILGPGGGITIRAGWRGTGPLYIGGAYELTKQDPNKQLRLALLQQLRGEARYYFVSGRDAEPYLSTGLGLAGYGNEWGVDTFGPTAFLGLGVEAQITRQTVVGAALAYRLIYFNSFRDSSGAAREGGVAQLIGLDLVLEQRQPIFTERRTAAGPRADGR